MSLRNRASQIFAIYPRQFWLMFAGMLISTIGSSMIWPFLMIYISKKLNTPLTVTASLLTISAVSSLVASLLGGPVIDRVGRKGIMVFSLVINGIAYAVMGHAGAWWQFALLQTITGAVNPLYRTAADTMVADMIPPKNRVQGYSMMRLSNNLGISLGPVIGGTMAATSYTLAFYGAAIGLAAYGVLMAIFALETMPAHPAPTSQSNRAAPPERFGGYLEILRDWQFMRFVFNFAAITVTAILIWTVMPVHANRIYGVAERQYAYIPMTNAIMVVLFQTGITWFFRRYHPLAAMTIGALFYTAAMALVARAVGFSGFWIAMVVMTVGELILAPISSTYAANLAPIDKRGRYIGLFGLSWPLASGLGPLFGGILSDQFGPLATWQGGFIVGSVSSLLFLAFYLQSRRRLAPEAAVEALPPAEPDGASS